MTGVPTLAEETIVERKGDDVLDRQPAEVLAHKPRQIVMEAETGRIGVETSPDTAGGEVATGDQGPSHAEGHEAEANQDQLGEQIAADEQAIAAAEYEDHTG